MVRTTRDDVTARGLSNVDLVVADASMPTLEPASFDVACASLVAFFLPDPLAGLRAWRALLAPGGRIGISTFGPRDQTWVEVDALFRPYLPPQMLDARTTGDAGPFASDAGVEGLLTDAGFHQPRTVSRQMSTTFVDGEQWHTWSWSHGQRAMWEFVPEAERPAVKERALDVLRGTTDADGRLSLTQEVRYTLGDRDPA